MTVPAPHEVTQLLHAWRCGEQAALDKLIPLIYAELHRLAHIYMLRGRSGHAPLTSAPVDEAYLRLTDSDPIEWQDRAHIGRSLARGPRSLSSVNPRTPLSRKSVRKLHVHISYRTPLFSLGNSDDVFAFERHPGAGYLR